MKKSEEGRRVQRVEKEVLEFVSRYLMRSFKGDFPGLVTITQVKMPADLKSARIYFSVLNGTEAEQEETAELLQDRASEIQHDLAKHLSLRYTPKLKFFYDQSLDQVLKIDQILHGLSKEKKNSSEEE